MLDGGLMKGKGTTISVALATYNGLPYLGSQLESMATQIRAPDEIVIGDDQSSDDTALVVERFAARHRIPTHWQRNPTRVGSSRNFELVIGRCSGDIVVFADQDDLWMPHKLARLEAALAADPGAAYVFSDGLLIDGRGKALPGTLFGSLAFNATERAAFRAGSALGVLVKHNVVVGATLAVRRAALLRLLPFETGWVHDYYLALGLTALGRGIVLDEPLIHYRRHARQQIGVADITWKAAIRLARRQSSEQSRLESVNFERLRLRLLALGVDRELCSLEVLSGKARFMAQRAEMRARPGGAPPLIWRALRDGGYGQYGVGWRQLVIDLVALGVGPGPAHR